MSAKKELIRGKVTVLVEFDTNLADPGAQKSGEYLREHILDSAKRALDRKDKDALIEVLREWLDERSEPKTMLAVEVIKELRLTELRKDLEELRDAIEKRKAFKPFYVRWVDSALTTLGNFGEV
ncbi:hypothetical protein EPN96_10810 [bacterium]|nr:MAG: hypothetical protein EPN96_10810 [bacterium]